MLHELASLSLNSLPPAAACCRGYLQFYTSMRSMVKAMNAAASQDAPALQPDQVGSGAGEGGAGGRACAHSYDAYHRVQLTQPSRCVAAGQAHSDAPHPHGHSARDHRCGTVHRQCRSHRRRPGAVAQLRRNGGACPPAAAPAPRL